METRKFIKQYLEFLKSSQRFYREYISTLNARFGGLPELEQIAQNIMKNNGMLALSQTFTNIHSRV